VSIEITLPEGFEKEGNLLTPPVIAAGAHEIYDGKVLEFTQTFKVSPDVKPGMYTMKFRVAYQSCNNEMCLPPMDEVKEETITIK
jgi:hypothetical protein